MIEIITSSYNYKYSIIGGIWDTGIRGYGGIRSIPHTQHSSPLYIYMVYTLLHLHHHYEQQTTPFICNTSRYLLLLLTHSTHTPQREQQQIRAITTSRRDTHAYDIQYIRMSRRAGEDQQNKLPIRSSDGDFSKQLIIKKEQKRSGCCDLLSSEEVFGRLILKKCSSRK